MRVQMSGFHCHGALPANSPLFHGRESELDILHQTCRRPVEHYIVIYGGRQTGKTSLQVQLMNHLPASILRCWIDCQNIPHADEISLMDYLTRHISRAIGIRENQPNPFQSLRMDFGEWLAHYLPEGRSFVLWIEELGALPQRSREYLANVLRAVFSARLQEGYQALDRFLVILSGGIELYDLASTRVSPFMGICEPVYLSDLTETATQNIFRAGAQHSSLRDWDPITVGSAIYALSDGQAYLTQRIGEKLEQRLAKGLLEKNVSLAVEDAAREIREQDPYFARLRQAIAEYGLYRACQSFLDRALPFSRVSSDELLKLELLGVAKEKEGCWTIRNPLLEKSLRGWLETYPVKDAGVSNQNRQEAEYIIYVQNSENISIGDNQRVNQRGSVT